MAHSVDRILDRYDAGMVDRRQLVRALATLGVATAGPVQGAEEPSTFRAVGLNDDGREVVSLAEGIRGSALEPRVERWR